MKKKELNVLKNKTVSDLGQDISKKRDDKLKLEVALSEGKEHNLRALKNIRRDIAQMLTIKNIISAQEKKQPEEEKGKKEEKTK